MPSIQAKKRRIIGGAVLAIALWCALPVKSDEEPNKVSPHEPADAVVVLTVDYGDGAQKRYPQIPWKKQITVLNALDWAERHPRGIRIEKRGKAATTLITKIDDLKNQGGGKRNWVFRVNDKLADRSCGVFELKRGDRILWKFERYQ